MCSLFRESVLYSLKPWGSTPNPQNKSCLHRLTWKTFAGLAWLFLMFVTMVTISCHLPYHRPLLRPFSLQECPFSACQMLSLRSSSSESFPLDLSELLYSLNIWKLGHVGHMLPPLFVSRTLAVWWLLELLFWPYIFVSCLDPLYSSSYRVTLPIADKLNCSLHCMEMGQTETGGNWILAAGWNKSGTWVVSPQGTFQRGSTCTEGIQGMLGYTF